MSNRFAKLLYAIGCAGILLLLSCAPKGAKVVGVAKFVSHPALDALEKGILDVRQRAQKLSVWLNSCRIRLSMH